VGRVCVKKTGREAGKQCVVVDTIDKNFVLVTGPEDVTGVRRRRANVDHLEPTEVKVSIKRGADDDEVRKVLSKLKEAKPEKKPRRKRKTKEEETPGASEDEEAKSSVGS